MSTTSETETQEWTYLGRYLRGTKLSYSWRKSDGTELLVDKLAASAIGGHYAVKVQGNRVFLNPHYLGTTVDADERALLVATDGKQRRDNQRRLAEARMESSDELDRATKALELLASKCRNYAELAALQNEVHNRLATAWRR